MRDEKFFSKQATRPFLYLDANHEMQSSKWRIGFKIRLKWTVPWFSVFVDQTNLKIIWKFSLSQYRYHKTPIDVENCVKSALNSNHRNQNFTVITNWGGGDYQFRSALAEKQIWVAVITIWGTLDSLPHWIQKPKTKVQIAIFLKFWVVFTVSSFVDKPVVLKYINTCFYNSVKECWIMFNVIACWIRLMS